MSDSSFDSVELDSESVESVAVQMCVFSWTSCSEDADSYAFPGLVFFWLIEVMSTIIYL